MTTELIDTHLTLDKITRTANLGSVAVLLSPKEWAVLEFMLGNPGWHSPQVLKVEMGWQHLNTIRAYASRLNKKFGQPVVKNRPGWGYSVG